MKMYPIVDSSRSTIPAFLNKLWKMVDDEKTDDLICWRPNGNSFVIKNQTLFCNNLLPLFYKHSNMASFVRQLNIYDFHKVSSIEGGLMRGEKDTIEFMHPYFKRDKPQLMEHIKRKIAAKTGKGDDKQNVEIMSQVLQEVEEMRTRQISLNSQLTTMKQHNVALWRELSVLRRKHQKQQQIVNKLIQFLVSMVHSSHNLSGLGVKRKYPLMINDISQPKKVRKFSNVDGPTIHELDEPVLEEGEVLPENTEPLIEMYSPDSHDVDTNEVEIPCVEFLSDSKKKSSSSKLRNKSRKQEKTTIRKVDDKPKILKQEILQKEIPTVYVSSDEADALREAANEYGFIINHDENNEPEQYEIEMPDTIDISQLKKESTDPTPEISYDPILTEDLTTILPTEPVQPEPGPSKENTSIQSYSSVRNPEDIDKHLDAMQSDLDSIKDLLVHEGYSIDANTLLGLFGCEDPMSYTLPMANNDAEPVETAESLDDSLGNELMCAPNFDVDMYGTPPPETSDLDRIDNILETLLASSDKK